VGMVLTDDTLRRAPKVLLHDHLDGGLRPQSIVELARDQNYRKLPTADAGELAAWFHRGARRRSLPMYLEGIAHTCRVMQTEEAGYQPKKHIDAFHYIQRANFNIAVHAGEAFGKESIWQAIQWCGAHRIGHATRLADDIVLDPHDSTRIARMGDLAQYVLDKR